MLQKIFSKKIFDTILQNHFTIFHNGRRKRAQKVFKNHFFFSSSKLISTRLLFFFKFSLLISSYLLVLYFFIQPTSVLGESCHERHSKKGQCALSTACAFLINLSWAFHFCRPLFDMNTRFSICGSDAFMLTYDNRKEETWRKEEFQRER